MTNIKEIKRLLPEFLYRNGIEIYNEGSRKKIKCLNPFHSEQNPSAQINDGSINCYGCTATYDVIDLVEWLGFASGFKNCVEYLKENYDTNIEVDSISNDRKPLFRGHKRKTDFKQLSIDDARKTYRISVATQRAIKAGIENPIFESAWPFLSESGLVNCVDFRFIDSYGRKHVITAWYDGKYVRITDSPCLIWGLDHINYDMPALIVEGAKCAKEAHEKIGDRFCVHTWNRGTSSAKYADWEPMYGYSDVFLLADRDRKFDKNGNEPVRQLGLKVMEEISSALLDGNQDMNCVIRESHECVEKIKKDGGDIIEMFQLMSISDIVNFIEKGY